MTIAHGDNLIENTEQCMQCHVDCREVANRFSMTALATSEVARQRNQRRATIEADILAVAALLLRENRSRHRLDRTSKPDQNFVNLWFPHTTTPSQKLIVCHI